MPVSEVLNKFRKGDYGDDQKKEESSSASRVINLTEEEQKFLGENPEAGQEVSCVVTGKLEDGHFHVMSIRPQGGEITEEDTAKVAGMDSPMMRMQTQPSPS
jgi:hypothetical protein